MVQDCHCTVVRRLARNVSALYDEALRPVGINIAQFAILRKIERAGSVSLTELGRLSDLDRSTVGRNAKILERMQLIAAQPGRDKREAALVLTEAGVQRLAAGAPLWQRAQDNIAAAIKPADAEHLRAILLVP